MLSIVRKGDYLDLSGSVWFPYTVCREKDITVGPQDQERTGEGEY